MMDSNKHRAKKKQELAKNKRAFNEIIGDPFSDDGQDGVYNQLHQSSSISSIEGSYGESPGIVYAGKPSVLDFFCDVDMVIRDVIENTKLREEFGLIYFQYELTIWDDNRRNKYEQLIGKELLRRGISPIKRYFTVTKKRDGK
jgi:hypothetical protein